jgi:uncharacterized protein (DUF2267 family)
MAFSFKENKRDAIELLNTVAQELNTDDNNKAGRIFRAVLHAIRDRLPVNDAVHFSAALPIIWKGIYFDQYDPTIVPITIRSREDWINYIRSKNAFAANNDFQQDNEITDAFKGVFAALQKRMPEGQLQQVRDALSQEIQELLES